MQTIISFIVFLVYTTAIFFIENYNLLAIVFVINIILMSILKVSYKKTLFFIAKILPFIIFTGIVNFLLGGIKNCVIISLKLILVCQITYIFSEKMTPKKIQFAVEKILIPLKVFKINTKEIGIIVAIAISFIPIIQKEVQNLKYSLIAKGFRINFRNFLKKPSLIFVPLITSIIRRTNEIEESLVSKGYMG